MYKYIEFIVGKCEKGDLLYKVWMIIVVGVGGFIIFIFFFVIVIQCVRRKREFFIFEKYVFDEG